MAIKPEAVFESVKKASGVAAQKAADMVERSKLGLEVASKEGELSDLFDELGRAVYEANKNNMHGMTPEALISIIDAKIAEIDELKARRAEKADPVCAGCGKPLDDTFDFCPRCGTKNAKSASGCADKCDCGCKDGKCDDDCCKDEKCDCGCSCC